MLLTRISSAIAGIIIFIFFIFWGSLPFTVLMGLITLLAIREYNRLLPEGSRSNVFFSIFIIVYTYLTNMGVLNLTPGVFLTTLLFLFFIYHLFKENYSGILSRLGYNLLGLIYIAGGLSFILLLRDFNMQPFSGTRALWLVLLATWATDVGAYFSGRFFGRNSLAVEISPNKTIEGAIGGILLSTVIVSVYIHLMEVFSWYWIVYAILASILSILGDLFESSLKRDSGRKDSGSLIPGHGGILDRFDSLLFSAPFTYFFLIYIL